MAMRLIDGVIGDEEACKSLQAEAYLENYILRGGYEGAMWRLRFSWNSVNLVSLTELESCLEYF